MSLGVASVLLAIVAMVPLGTSVLGDSIDDTVKAMIARTVAAELSTWEAGELMEDLRHFDHEGNATESGGELCRYTAWVERTHPARLPSRLNPEGETELSAAFTRCVIHVAANPDAREDYFRDPLNRGHVFRMAIVAPGLPQEDEIH